LEELFGGQVAGINQLQQQTILSLQSAVTKLDQVASGFEAAGTRTADAMGARLTEAVEAMEARQSRMNEQMTMFVEQLRDLVGRSQNETNDRLQATLNEIGEAARLQLATLRDQGDHASAQHAAREERVATQTHNMLSQLAGQVETAVGAIRGQAEQSATTQAEREQRISQQADEVAAKLAALTERLVAEVHAVAGEIGGAIEAMRGVTSDAVTRMNAGAETLYLAADQFAKAGQEVNSVLHGAKEVAERLAGAATDVSASAVNLREVSAGHAAARDGLAAMVVELKITVENAKREASLTEKMLVDLREVSKELADAQRDVPEYLNGVGQVLVEAQKEFQTGILAAVKKTNTEVWDAFHQAVKSLKDVIEDIDPDNWKNGRGNADTDRH
jgi:predicted  nucleic acid-binding Zn-ribbon protein